LARLPGVIDDESAGEDLRRALLENLEGLVDGDARREDGGDLGRVELLEAVDLARFRGFLQLREGGELQELAVGAPYVGGAELVGIKAALALDLRDDLVAASLGAEAVDVVPAEEGAQVGADLLEVKSERGDLVPVEGDFDLRLVVLQITVGKDEDAAREGGGVPWWRR
jgi:hypothetical protein